MKAMLEPNALKSSFAKPGGGKGVCGDVRSVDEKDLPLGSLRLSDHDTATRAVPHLGDAITSIQFR